MESPLVLPHLPLPLASVNSNYEELPSSEIDRTKLAPIPFVLWKYSALHTECKIGELCVKLAREAIFGNAVLKRYTLRGWNGLPALPQMQLALLKTTVFEQFPLELS